MDLDDDLDTHVCLRCQQTIVGLDLYVAHKKRECPALKEKTQTPVNGDERGASNNDKPAGEEQRCDPGEPSGPFVDETTLVVKPPLGQDTFFSSLELQCKVIPEKPDKNVQTTTTWNKDGCDNLPLVELEFSNLEQGKITENELLERSDDEDGFDFAKELSGNESEDDIPPDSHTGGKWKPGDRRGDGKHYSATPSPPPASHTKGKWLPGKRKLDHDYVVCDFQEDVEFEEEKATEEPNSDCYCEVCNKTLCNKYAYLKHVETSYHLKMEKIKNWGENAEKMPSNEKEDEAVETYNCEDCNKTFISKFLYLRHVNSEYHEKRTKNGPNKENSETNGNESSNVQSNSRLKIPKRTEFPELSEEDDKLLAENSVYECPPCSRSFTSRRYLAQHLLTIYHMKRAKDHPAHGQLILDNLDLITKQAPFQCGICSFYFNQQHNFMEHWKSEDHVSNTKQVTGPLFCVECEYVCNDNEAMLLHLSGIEHQDLVTTLNYQHPIVIRQKRSDITCTTCNAKFLTTFALKKHHESTSHERGDLTSNNKTKLDCNHCEFKTTSKTNLRIHMRRRHTKEKPYRCIPCDKSFCDAGSLDAHNLSLRHRRHVAAEQIVDEDSICGICGNMFVDLTALREHTKSSHPNSVKECGRCQGKFVLDFEYDVHVCRRSVAEKKDLPETIDAEALEIYACEVCGFKSTSYSKVLFHQTLQHGNPEEIPVIKKVCLGNERNGSNGTGSRQCKLQIRTMKKYKCPYCLGMFAKSALQVHIHTHTGERPFKCNLCDMAFAQKSTLNMHLKRHAGCKEFKCDQCSFAAEKPSRLKRHKLIHASHRPKNCLCDICGAAHHDRWTLRHHMKLHFGKAHKCPYDGCEQSFRCRSEMAIHVRVHTDEKPFLCDMCGYRGRSQHQLTKHRRSHTGERPFKCKHCSYSAHLSSHLQRHMRIHTGSKPYKCPYCKYTCNTQENIRKHILKTKKHEGKKVYPCRLCDFGCNSTSEYKTHLLDFHREEVKAADLDVVSYLAGVYDRHDDKKPVASPIPYVPRNERQKLNVPKKKKEKVKGLTRKKKASLPKSSKIKREPEQPSETSEYVTISSLVNKDNDKPDDSIGQVVYSIQLPDKFEYTNGSEVDLQPLDKTSKTILIPIDSIQNSFDSQSQVYIPAQFDEPAAHEDVIIPDEITEEALLESNSNTFVIYLH